MKIMLFYRLKIYIMSVVRSEVPPTPFNVSKSILILITIFTYNYFPPLYDYIDICTCTHPSSLHINAPINNDFKLHFF